MGNIISKCNVTKSQSLKPIALKNLVPLKDLIIRRMNLESAIYRYLNSIPFSRRGQELPSELLALQCIMNGYKNNNEPLSENDKQLMICIIDLSRAARSLSTIQHKDLIIEEMCEELRLLDYLKPTTIYFEDIFP